MTLYIQITEITAAAPSRDPCAWTPWIRAAENGRDETVQLAAHKRIRESGIMNRRSETTRADLRVWHTPKLPSTIGECVVHYTDFQVSKL